MRSLRWPVVAGLLLLSACAGASDGGGNDASATGRTASTSPTASTATTVTPTGSAPAGSELLAFRAPAIGGGEVDASIYQGRPTLLWFWSPW